VYVDEYTRNITSSCYISKEIVDDINQDCQYRKLEKLKYDCSLDDLKLFILNNGKKTYTTHDDKGCLSIYSICCVNFVLKMKYYEFDDENTTHSHVEYLHISKDDLPF